MLAWRSADLSFWGAEMHKILGTLLVGAAVVGGVTLAKGASTASTPEGKMCARLEVVCHTDEPDGISVEQCTHQMKEIRTQAGNASFDKSERCIEEAQSCAAAAGCMVGGIGVGMTGEMLKGLGNAMTK